MTEQINYFKNFYRGDKSKVPYEINYHWPNRKDLSRPQVQIALENKQTGQNKNLITTTTKLSMSAKFLAVLRKSKMTPYLKYGTAKIKTFPNHEKPL